MPTATYPIVSLEDVEHTYSQIESHYQAVEWHREVPGIGGKTGIAHHSVITLEEASFIVGDGYDGVVISRDEKCISESAHFLPPPSVCRRTASTIDLPLYDSRHLLNEVFVAFSPAWSNYYHWLVDTISRLGFAARICSRSCVIPIPNFHARLSDQKKSIRTHLGYSAAVWSDSLIMSGLHAHITTLPSGRFFAKKLHFVPVEPKWAFYDVQCRQNFIKAACAVASSKGQTCAKRLFILRKKVLSERISSSDALSLSRLLSMRGFSSLHLEDIGFEQQVNLFRAAEVVVAPHGAGLANMIFSSPECLVVELGKLLISEHSLRRGYRSLAEAIGLQYEFVDGTVGGFLYEDIDGILTRRGIK